MESFDTSTTIAVVDGENQSRRVWGERGKLGPHPAPVGTSASSDYCGEFSLSFDLGVCSKIGRASDYCV
jgi:hypothetical protein